METVGVSRRTQVPRFLLALFVNAFSFHPGHTTGYREIGDKGNRITDSDRT